MSGSSKKIGPESRARIRNDSESLPRTRTRRAARTVVANGATSPFRVALNSGQLTEEDAYQKSAAEATSPPARVTRRARAPGENRRGRDQMLVTTSPLVWPFTRSVFVP